MINQKNYTVKSLGRSTIWSVLNQSISQLLVMAVFLITARYVSKEAFGIMATGMLVIELFKQVLIESVGKVFLTNKSLDAEDFNAGFFLIFLSGFISAVLLFFLAHPLADFFGHREVATSLQWISLLLLTLGLSKMHEIYLTLQLRFKTLALRSIGSILLGGAIGVTMAINGYGINSLIAQQIVTAVASLLWLWAACPWKPGFGFKRQSLRNIVHSAKYLSLTSIAGQFSGQGDILMTSYYLGPVATGIYSAAKRLLTATNMIIISGLNNVALPAQTAFSHDEEQFRRSFLTCINLTAFIIAPLYAGLAALAPDIIQILLGPKWAEVAPIMAILAIASFNRNITQYASNVLVIRQKSHIQAILTYLDAAANLCLLFIFARYGLMWVSAAFVAKTLVFSPITTAIALRLLGMGSTPYLKALFPPVTISLIMGALVAYLRMIMELSAWLSVTMLSVTGAILYFALMFAFDRKTLNTAWTMISQTIGKDRQI